jgi:iron(II)-dependent oxidoreductase
VIRDGKAFVAFGMEARGFGALLSVAPGAAVDGLADFIALTAAANAKPLSAYSGAWKALPQTCVDIAATAPAAAAPAGMVTIPGGEFVFAVGGVEIEGFNWAGQDVQYAWEDTPRRHHRQRMELKPFHIDRHPVTNAQYKAFIDATGYAPADAINFLAHWVDGAPRAGWENKPVTWVSIEDARAYAAWARKRLPREWEWQYAAQGIDGRSYPWGNQWDDTCVPRINRGQRIAPPEDVGSFPQAASPFGVEDLVGHVWQWTEEFVDEHTRVGILRGGSSYQPQTSHWYFPQAYRLDQHGKYLLMAPAKDRSGMLGFRCVVDAA